MLVSNCWWRRSCCHPPRHHQTKSTNTFTRILSSHGSFLQSTSVRSVATKRHATPRHYRLSRPTLAESMSPRSKRYHGLNKIVAFFLFFFALINRWERVLVVDRPRSGTTQKAAATAEQQQQQLAPPPNRKPWPRRRRSPATACSSAAGGGSRPSAAASPSSTRPRRQPSVLRPFAFAPHIPFARIWFAPSQARDSG